MALIDRGGAGFCQRDLWPHSAMRPIENQRLWNRSLERTADAEKIKVELG